MNRLLDAWQKGLAAQQRGFWRLCPFCDDEIREMYWYAGYDGIPLDKVNEENAKHTERA